ncbi:MAG: TonB family protein, partial [Prolixibacteraceae bacterium]|nr:TonB family protein [Prolixibacteraceae bacterium]
LNEIDPETIRVMNVLKGDAAIAKYGDKAKDGAIEIITIKEAPQTSDEVFVVVEEMPQFPGGTAALAKFITDNLAPTNTSGKVYVQFVVNKDGSVSNAKVLRSTSAELNKPALDVIKMLPRWVPGKQRGVPVKVAYNIPIEFH